MYGKGKAPNPSGTSQPNKDELQATIAPGVKSWFGMLARFSVARDADAINAVSGAQ
jgi:hypothetical protein